MHIKAEGMIQFDIFHVFVENSVNSELFSELYSNQPKSEIYPKMPMFEQLKKQVPVNSKKFDPSLERSWYELYRIIKAHGPKNQPPSSPGL